MIAILSMLSSLAFAAAPMPVGEISLCSQSGSELEVSASVTGQARGHRRQPTYTSNVTVDGRNIPSVSGKCFVSDRPSTRYIMCAHENDQMRVEVYTHIDTPAGLLRKSGAVIWTRGGSPVGVKLQHCDQ